MVLDRRADKLAISISMTGTNRCCYDNKLVLRDMAKRADKTPGELTGDELALLKEHYSHLMQA